MTEGAPEEINPLAPMARIGETEDGEWAIFTNPDTGTNTHVPTRTYFEPDQSEENRQQT